MDPGVTLIFSSTYDNAIVILSIVDLWERRKDYFCWKPVFSVSSISFYCLLFPPTDTRLFNWTISILLLILYKCQESEINHEKINIDPNFGCFLLIIQFPLKLPWMFHQCFWLRLTSYLCNLAWFSSSQTCLVYWPSIENNKIWHNNRQRRFIMNMTFRQNMLQ